MAGLSGSRYLIQLLLFALIVLSGCGNMKDEKRIIIFHAGSLSVPFKRLAGEYEKRHPGVKVLLEPAGSLVCARKVTELHKPCDIVASADYVVIDQLLLPEYTDWSIRFATNELVLAYLDRSKYSEKVNSDNWYDIILSEEVIYSRSDPNSDPGGYRAVFTLMLAEKFYSQSGLADRLMAKNNNFMRPKEVDLIALLESHAVDYIFIYESVAMQHNLKYIKLPDEINLSNPDYNELYNTVGFDVTGSSAESKMFVKGEYINYSITVLNNSLNPEEAVDFLEFLLSPDGMELFRKSGQEPIIPFSTEKPELIPSKLLKYLKTTN